jgi:enoyl-CoA hydratase/carnithine racemase
MLSLDIPLLAEIRGACMGAGLEIASCCDVRLADVTAKFGAPIARLGFPMAPREAALVHSAVGDATARAMLLAAQVYDASAMAQRGFLTTLCEGPALAEAVSGIVQRIESLSPQAARLNKQALRTLRSGPTADKTDMAAAYAYAETAEHREGVEAFLAKRPAQFR